MDDPECDPQALEAALRALATTNRRLGGFSAIWRPLQRALAGRETGSIALLDVGTGGGDIARDVGARLSGLGWRPTFTLSDLHAETLARSRSWTSPPPGTPSTFRYVRLRAECLPFADGAFDIVLSANMLHHLETDAAIEFLREAERVSCLGWLVADLERSRAALAALTVLSRTVWRGNALPRVDGPVSIRRSFTVAEARELVRRAGVGPAGVGRRRLFRLLIASEAFWAS